METERMQLPLDDLRMARAAIQSEIEDDYQLMKALTARVTAREDVLRHLDVAISVAEEWGIGVPTTPDPMPKRRGRPKGLRKPTLALPAAAVSDDVPAAFRDEVAALLNGAVTLRQR